MWYFIVACGNIEQSNEISSTDTYFSDGYNAEKEVLYEDAFSKFDIEVFGGGSSESEQPEHGSGCDRMYMLHQQGDGTAAHQYNSHYIEWHY